MKQIKYTKDQEIVLDVLDHLIPTITDNAGKARVKDILRKYDIKPQRLTFYDYLLFYSNGHTTIHVKYGLITFCINDMFDFLNNPDLYRWIPDLKNFYAVETRDEMHGDGIENYSSEKWIDLYPKED